MYISTMPTDEKPLEWIGSSHKDLMALPADVWRFFGTVKFAEAFAKELRK